VKVVRRSVDDRGLPFAAGSLGNSAAAYALTSILIFINKTYRVDGAGIRITDILRLFVNIGQGTFILISEQARMDQKG
jgi:hypothetical protein